MEQLKTSDPSFSVCLETQVKYCQLSSQIKQTCNVRFNYLNSYSNTFLAILGQKYSNTEITVRLFVMPVVHAKSVRNMKKKLRLRQHFDAESFEVCVRTEVL